MNQTPVKVDGIVLELFVQGQSVRSNEAIDVVRRICESRLEGACALEVIDIRQQPERTRDAHVVAAPALVRRRPEPVRRIVGQLTEDRVLEWLGLAEPPGASGDT